MATEKEIFFRRLIVYCARKVAPLHPRAGASPAPTIHERSAPLRGRGGAARSTSTNMCQREGPGPDKSASGDSLLSLPSYQALCEERDHRWIERRKILGAATRHPVAILDHLL